MKKYFSSSKNKKEPQVKSIIKYHLDDKGRRIFDFDKPIEDETFTQIDLNKKEQVKIRNENKIKNLNTETSKFKCEICNLVFTDNTSYKDHLNGKMHNLNIGKSLSVKNSTLEKVREKLLNKKRERDQEKLNKIKK